MAEFYSDFLKRLYESKLYDRNGEPITVEKWAELRQLGEEYVRVGWFETKRSRVSTVWLGLDHNFFDDGPPILFETLVFDGPLGGEMRRYATEQEARDGHAEMVALVQLEEELE